MDDVNSRQVERTRKLLVGAFMALISEKSYDKLTIQEITDRANLGRTTFYTHFQSKEELFLYSHRSLFRQIGTDIFTETGQLRESPSPVLVGFLESLLANRNMYFLATGGKSGAEVIDGMKKEIATSIENYLRQYFAEKAEVMAFDILAHYLAGAMISVITWWIEKHIKYTPAELAQQIHRLQYAILRDLPGLKKHSEPSDE